jgi:hypothetical protein
MKLKAGDRVKFLNDTGGGIVTEILDDKTVSVRIEEGFDIPVAAAELIIDSDETRIFRKDDEMMTGQADKYSTEEPDGEIREDRVLSQNLPESALKSVHFGLVPASDITVYKSEIITYLINNCDYYIYYLIGCLDRDSYYYCRSGMLEPNTKEYIRTFTQAEISKIRNFHFQVLFISKGKYYPQQPVNTYIDISKLSLYKDKNYRENEFFNEKALILKIAGDNPDEERDSITASPVAKASAGVEEVDLHIHELVDSYSGLSEGEILRIQLGKFASALEKAIEEKAGKIVFIHGVGNGKLKYEIRKILDTKYPDLTYQDASFKEYGFGATLVKLT